MAFDLSGNFYGILNGNSLGGGGPFTHLISINKTTGAITDLGAVLNRTDGLDAAPAPVPPTAAGADPTK